MNIFSNNLLFKKMYFLVKYIKYIKLLFKIVWDRHMSSYIMNTDDHFRFINPVFYGEPLTDSCSRNEQKIT